MKKQISVILSGCIIFSLIACYLGYKIGHKNGYIEAASQDDRAFWNLLFLRSASKEDLIRFNEESLLSPVVTLHALLNDPFLHGRNKQSIRYHILAAKDYIKYFGRSVSEDIETKIADLPFEPDLYVDGEKVPLHYFDLIEKEQDRIFAEVWEEDSYLLDHIIAAKETEAQQGERGSSE